MQASPIPVRAALLLSLLLGAGAAGCKYLPFGRSAKAAAVEAPAAPIRVLKLDSTTLNLADPNPTYLRLGVSLGVTSAATEGSDARLESLARDAIVSQASAATAADLLTPEGKEKLKQELLKSLQKSDPQADVQAIYFDEFLIQR